MQFVIDSLIKASLPVLTFIWTTTPDWWEKRQHRLRKLYCWEISETSVERKSLITRRLLWTVNLFVLLWFAYPAFGGIKKFVAWTREGKGLYLYSWWCQFWWSIVKVTIKLLVRQFFIYIIVRHIFDLPQFTPLKKFFQRMVFKSSKTIKHSTLIFVIVFRIESNYLRQNPEATHIQCVYGNSLQ